jgi:hypothetical protein
MAGQSDAEVGECASAGRAFSTATEVEEGSDALCLGYRKLSFALGRNSTRSVFVALGVRNWFMSGPELRLLTWLTDCMWRLDCSMFG